MLRSFALELDPASVEPIKHFDYVAPYAPCLAFQIRLPTGRGEIFLARTARLKDKFGLSWQVIPSVLGDLLQDKDAEKSERVGKAMLEMDKIDIKALQQAYLG